MGKLIVITKVEEIAEDKFVTVEFTKDGEFASEIISLETLYELVRNGVEVEVAEELAEEFEMIDLTYIEVAIEDEYVDVYLHQIYIEATDFTYNAEGGLVKTYKREKSAVKFAKEYGAFGVVYSY